MSALGYRGGFITGPTAKCGRDKVREPGQDILIRELENLAFTMPTHPPQVDLAFTRGFACARSNGWRAKEVSRRATPDARERIPPAPSIMLLFLRLLACFAACESHLRSAGVRGYDLPTFVKLLQVHRSIADNLLFGTWKSDRPP
jgi:hypothetical protein